MPFPVGLYVFIAICMSIDLHMPSIIMFLKTKCTSLIAILDMLANEVHSLFGKVDTH